MLRLLVCSCFGVWQLGCLSAAEVVITDLGAVGDGTALNTASIQQAIDQVSGDGGGKVTVPAGVFKTGACFSNLVWNCTSTSKPFS